MRTNETLWLLFRLNRIMWLLLNSQQTDKVETKSLFKLLSTSRYTESLWGLIHTQQRQQTDLSSKFEYLESFENKVWRKFERNSWENSNEIKTNHI